MLGATWNVHLRVPPGTAGGEASAHDAARRCGQLLDEEVLAQEPLAVRFAYLRRHEAERLVRTLRSEIPSSVVWIEMERSLGIAE